MQITHAFNMKGCPHNRTVFLFENHLIYLAKDLLPLRYNGYNHYYI